MKALIIILAIIAFFVLLLSVKVSATVHFDETFALDVNWAFIKLHILPKDESKPKKEKKKKKKKKEKKPKNDKPEEEKKDETVPEPKQKGDNIFKKFYRNRGVDGLLELLHNLTDALKGMFGRILRAFIIDDLFISLIVGAADSAATAEKFGKTCAEVYPALGFLTSKMRIRKPRCEVIPDFIEGRNKARLHAKISVVPRRLIGAVLIVGIQLLNKVLLKFLYGAKFKKKVKVEK